MLLFTSNTLATVYQQYTGYSLSAVHWLLFTSNQQYAGQSLPAIQWPLSASNTVVALYHQQVWTKIPNDLHQFSSMCVVRKTQDLCESKYVLYSSLHILSKDHLPLYPAYPKSSKIVNHSKNKYIILCQGKMTNKITDRTKNLDKTNTHSVFCNSVSTFEFTHGPNTCLFLKKL